MSSMASSSDASNHPYPTHVSDASFEFLIAEVLRYVERSTPPKNISSKEDVIFAKEMAAAKMERKFTITLNVPASAREFISWQRINTDYYDKDTFLQLRKQFK